MHIYVKSFKENKHLICLTAVAYSYFLLLPTQGETYLGLKDMGISISTAGEMLSFGILILSIFTLAFLPLTEVAVRRMMMTSAVLCPIFSILFFSSPDGSKAAVFMLLCISSAPLLLVGYFFKSTVSVELRPYAMILAAVISFGLLVLQTIVMVIISAALSFGILNILLILIFPLLRRLPIGDKNTCTVAENPRHKVFPLKSAFSLFACVSILIALTTFSKTGIFASMECTVYENLLFNDCAYFLGMLSVFFLYGRVDTSKMLVVGIIATGAALSLWNMVDGPGHQLTYCIISIFVNFAFGIFEVVWASIVADMMQYSKNSIKLYIIATSVNAPVILLTRVICSVGAGLVNDIAYILNGTLILCFLVLALVPNLYNRFKKDFPDMIDNYEKILIDDERINELKQVGITDRELDVMIYVLANETRANIAKQMDISQNTVKTYISRIYTKLNVHSKSELRNLLRRK